MFGLDDPPKCFRYLLETCITRLSRTQLGCNLTTTPGHGTGVDTLSFLFLSSLLFVRRSIFSKMFLMYNVVQKFHIVKWFSPTMQFLNATTKQKIKRTEKKFNVYTHMRVQTHRKIFINTDCAICIFSIRVQLEAFSRR